MAAGFAPAGDLLVVYKLGYHWGFVSLLTFVAIDFFIVMFFVRNKKISLKNR